MLVSYEATVRFPVRPDNHRCHSHQLLLIGKKNLVPDGRHPYDYHRCIYIADGCTITVEFASNCFTIHILWLQLYDRVHDLILILLLHYVLLAYPPTKQSTRSALSNKGDERC